MNDLQQVGAWMKVNGESIYGTTASPFNNTPISSLKEPPAWGRFTRKGDKLYAHIFVWPKDGKLEIQGVEAKAVYLLSDKNKLLMSLETASNIGVPYSTIKVSLPAQSIDPIDTVVVFELTDVAKTAYEH